MKRVEFSIQLGCVKFPGKASQRETIKSVPQTNTGGLVEKTKVSELTFVKELGNIASVT